MILFFAALAAPIFACQPCLIEKSLDLQQTIERADLIVTGYRIFYKTQTKEDEPQFIDVQFKRVLKGKVLENTATVKSFYGMCPYGVVLPDAANYVLFLRESDGNSFTEVQKCSVKTLRLDGVKSEDDDKNAVVTLDDGKTKISLDELLRERIVPKQYRRVVELLQLLKHNDDFYSKDEEIARRKADELLSFVSSKTVTFYNVNDKPKTHRFTKAQMQRAFARKSGAAFDLLINLGNNYAMPYPQYSTVRYDSFRNNVVIEISDDWRLTFMRVKGELKLTRLEYLQVEGD